MKKVLLAGESWFCYTTHVKGFDSFYTSKYESGERYIKSALENAGYKLTFLPNHVAAEEFPYKMEELSEYAAVILSDIGANTLNLSAATFERSERRPNRIDLIRDYVLDGGALLMIGGYMTFSGIDAKGKWHDTSVQDVLPVIISQNDDRAEHPEGAAVKVVDRDHEIMRGLPLEWPRLLGYNKLKIKSSSSLLATVNDDPLIAIDHFGKGKSAVFSSDCAPHWAPPEFCEWDYYPLLWKNILDWLTK